MPAMAVVGEVLDVLEQPGLGGAVERCVADVVTGVGVGIQSRQRVPPRLTVFGHVVVVPAVGLGRGQPLVDQRQHWDPRVAVLSQQQVEHRRGNTDLVRGEKRQRLW